MKFSPMRHRKERGELTEIRFMLMAASCGLVVCKPWGELHPFDFAVYCKRSRRFYRVQVKSCTSYRGGGYIVVTKRSGDRCYTSREIDFLAAYVIPEVNCGASACAREQSKRRSSEALRSL
jgi:hypothetical protein